MKKVKINIFSKINKKYRKHIIYLISIAFIFSAVLTILAIRQPLQIEEKIIDNNIEEKTSFNFEAIVKPSSLYPNGGRVTPDKVIFHNLTEDFIININSEIKTDKPVKVKAAREVLYKITAEKMWEREFILRQPVDYNLEGDSHNILNEELHININEINNYIAKIEEETLVKPNYILTVKSSVIGNVYDENDNILYEINNQLEIPFNLSGQYFSYAGETEEREFIITKSIEKVNIIPQYFELFDTRLSVIGSRLGFGITSIILLLLILLYVVRVLKTKNSSKTESYYIDKKNKSKIVIISNKLVLDDISYINLKTFKDLIKVAEEKDESIFKYEDNNLGIAYYYITCTSYIYVFKSVNVIKGSEIVQDA